MSLEELQEYEEKSMSDLRFLFRYDTANSMNCLTEALGMGLKGNGTIPAVYSARIQLAKHAGMQIMELVRKGYQASRHHDKGCVLKRPDRRYGARLFYKLHAASACNRA